MIMKGINNIDLNLSLLFRKTEYKEHTSVTFERCTIRKTLIISCFSNCLLSIYFLAFTFLAFTAYVGLFITVQAIVFGNWNRMSSSDGCVKRLKGGGCTLIIVTYIVNIATILLLRRYYRNDLQNNSSSQNQASFQSVDNTEHKY